MRPLLRALPFLLALPAPAQDRLTPELLWQLQRVSDPQLSPDGQTLLYHVRTYELADDRGVTQLWLLDVAAGTSAQFTTQGSNWNARWSPDGTEIAFLSTRDGAAQIYRMPIDGGEPRRITDHAGGVANLAWSPTGEHFSFTADVRIDPTLADRHPDLPHADAKIYDDLMVRHWDRWNDGTYSHLFVVPADGGEARDLMEGERVDTPLKPFGGAEQIAWAPDGRSIVYTAKRVQDPEVTTDSDLFEVSIRGGTHRNLTEALPGHDATPVFSPDGDELAFTSMARDGYESDRNRVFVLRRPDGELREATSGWDLSAAELAWAPDGGSLFVCADVRGTRQVFRLASTPGRAPEPVTRGRWHFGSLAVAPNGRALFALRQRTEHPYEVVRVDLGRGAQEGVQLTAANRALLAGLEMPEVEERWFDATDGGRIHSWVIYPPDFDPAKTWPMLLYCQGGPQSQVGQWFSYRWNFHLMAAQGYVVLAVNRRGLPGFGTQWNEQISRDWGGQAMRDLLSATDAMFEEPFVDRDRTAAVGASFGGYTTFWLMGHDEPDRFCAMVAHCGVFNLESMYLSTEELWFPNWDLGGPFWRSDAIQRDYDRFSPHRFVDKWDTPLLVIHGQRDYRVPFEQGLQAFTAARVQGVDARLLYFPDESHWVLSPQNGVLWHREFFEWLDAYCKPKARFAMAAPEGASLSTARELVRPTLLEQVDDTAIAQLYADGFEDLSLRDKILCYHLANAAIAGRDIFLDQKFVYNLAIRDVLEELYVRRDALAPAVRQEIERYTKLFWVHSGIHHAISARKMLLDLDLDTFKEALEAARKAGATGTSGLSADLMHRILTDPELYPSVTNKSPPGGADPLRASANNLYSLNLRSDDLHDFVERFPLNSRLVMRGAGGELVEEVYRTGAPRLGIPPGRYVHELRRVHEHLDEAIAVAPKPTAKALRRLTRYYRTGAPEDWRAYNIAWVQDTDSVVDTINGFVEVYLDARGQKGAWEAVVSFRNEAKTAAIEALAAKAQWFEDRMPWDAEFKKENVKGITARAISVITETGDSGPVTPIGINLPNDADVREQYGSKSVNLSNVVEAYDRLESGGSVGEFAWDDAEVARAEQWASISSDIHTNLHEVVGHASGKLRPEIQNPASKLGLYYSTLEEGRADLVALYWIADPQLEEWGIVPHADCARAEYEAYARNALVQLRRVPEGHRLEEDHMRNRQLVVHWLIANADGAIDVRTRDGKTYYVVESVDAFRAGCGRLLAEIMRIKATGDFKAGKHLVDTYGTDVDPRLHAEVLARVEGLGLPSVTGFVQPELHAVRDANGEITDVEVTYPCDLAEQMLRWSGRRK